MNSTDISKPRAVVNSGKLPVDKSYLEESIDVVYTWVDGTKPKFKERLKTYWHDALSVLPESISSQRFRNNDELRYSLRSLEAFAPWAGNIYIVTNGDIPNWLDTSHNRISIITHDEIFLDKSYLPTFNLNAIELQLRRLP
ncbi:MAG TPA: stealth family protein [Thermodesulfobacteriota bacterium]|nr:stealth family protein [Thermodesulfobacteriota bacterium]